VLLIEKQLDKCIFAVKLNALKQIYRYTFRYKGVALLVVLCNLLFVIFNLLSLVLFIPILQLIFRKPEEIARVSSPIWDHSFGGLFIYIKDWYNFTMYELVSDSPKSALLFVCLTVMLAFLFKNIFRYGAVWFQSQLRMAVVRDVRDKLFEKILVLPLSYYSNERKGDLMARMNSDVGEVEVAVVSMLELLFREPIAVSINIISLVYLSPELTLISLFLLPISAFVISRIGKSLKRTAKAGQEQTGLLFSAMEEALSGIRIIKAFNANGFILKGFKKINLTHQKLITKTFRKKDLSPLLNETLGAMVMLLLVWFGGNLILDQKGNGLTGEVFMTFIIVFSQLLRPIQGVSSSIANMTKANVSLERINNILEEDERIIEKPQSIVIKDLNNSVEFNNVSFGYGQEVVLNSINLRVKKGSSVALVGESGSGKSTMMDLLTRFYDVESGEVLIDGVNVKDLTIKSLRSLIGIVSQESILFNTSVTENIAFGDDNPSIEKVIEAAKTANAYDFIMGLENGFDTVIGERGNKLSGGQKQRLSIARAVYLDPQILILDEATSALDTESEQLVQSALERIMLGKTTFIIAHRLSTIINAEQIIVLSKGTIVEQGNHQDLLKLNGFYSKFCALQGIN
jgi:ATP-binding cassette, subfamily B, bacterial MsbA